jgi:hypothetical protein
MDTGRVKIRWNSKQEFMIQDYFTANNRFGFCNSGNGQVRMFMSNSHTPSNILFSKALTDTTYVDLKYILGVVSIHTTSTSDTTGALVVAGGLVFLVFLAANLDAPNNEWDHNDLWYDFNRNDFNTDTYR